MLLIIIIKQFVRIRGLSFGNKNLHACQPVNHDGINMMADCLLEQFNFNSFCFEITFEQVGLHAAIDFG